ncbi:MAG: DnaA regulatory inactivator Hda [Xanthomonadales bacterium]|nr:DnaA regulatory inactivator Hda [Xanthomonadales bacterium]
MLFSPQIPLPLMPRRDSRLEDFIEGPNAAVIEALRRMLDEPGSHVFLHGEEGSGKTYLLNALCLEIRERQGRAFYLALKRLPQDAVAALKGLEDLDLVCVDDLHVIAGDRDWEEALFHCFNRIRKARGRLLISSRKQLSSLDIGLPDLSSRLAWGLRLPLKPLADEDKLAVIARHSNALGFNLSDDVRNYLLKHHERSMSSLLRAVDQLHQVALTNKRRITIPLAREVLQAMDQERK